MEPNRKRPSVKKDANRIDINQPKFPSSQAFARPPATGTSSSSSSEDRSTSIKSSDDTSPEDQIEVVHATNERSVEISFPSHTPKIIDSSSIAKRGLELKFNSGPSAYFSANKFDVPADVNLSPQDGNRIPSPASISSLTSRPLEWDSGADVGYIAPGIETGLSTIERIALAQGSAILLPRSDPEGTTETGSKPMPKLAIPAVEKLIGTPAAESTLIKDTFLSPVVGLKPLLPEGISPIISSSVHVPGNSRETPKELQNEEARTSLELKFKHLSLAENNSGRNQEVPYCDPANVESNEPDTDSPTPIHVEKENLDDSKSGTKKTESKDFHEVRYSAKEESKSSDCLLKVQLETEPLFPLALKKSASCSNLPQALHSGNHQFLKPLKRHFQNSASSSSISTVIDRSKKKSRKLFLTSNSISERVETRSKASKFPRKILSPSKKFHFSNNSNRATQSCSPPKTQRLSSEPLDLLSTSKNSQVAFHTSIQQSILDELQQCVNEISNNFNSNSRSRHSGDKIAGTQNESKKGSGSTRENCSTLESIASVHTNDSWAMDSNAKDSLTSAEKAKSFEYLPGDIYERNSSEHFQQQKKSESSCSTSEKIDFSESSKEEFWNPSSLNLFECELERGVNLLKDFINNSTSFDSRKKLLLVKKIAKKLIELENESYQKSNTKDCPSGYRKPNAKAPDSYLRNPFSNRQSVKGSLSELSGSTRISQSYVDTTSGSSCLNLVMKPLKKSTSVESSSDQPEKVSSGIRHIQENYRSNNCTFNSDGEQINDETYADAGIAHPNSEKITKAAESQRHAKMRDIYGPESSSVGWSKSSCSMDNQQQAEFCGMEFRQSAKKLPPRKHHMLSPRHHRQAKYRDASKNKMSGFKLAENSNDLIDGRTVNLGRGRSKPFLISDNDSSSKGYFDHNDFPWPDWQKPTSDSERRYEEKLLAQKDSKKDSTLLYKYLDAERRNHLLWIQSEINHLSNLKALIEKQAELKENFKLLKGKKVDGKGDFRGTHLRSLQKCSLESMKVSGMSNNTQFSAEPTSVDASSNSSDKENKDITNKNLTRAAVAENLVKSKFGLSSHRNASQNQKFRSQLSSNDSRYISADSDVTNNTWAEESAKISSKSPRKSKHVSLKQNSSSVPKKVKKPVSYTILFDPPKVSPNFLSRKVSHKIIKDAESSANSKISELSLQECLAKKHPEIIRRAEFRRNCIAELSCLRQLQNERKKQIVSAIISSEEVPNPSVSLPSLREKRIFTQKKLRQQTEKKYRQSFEVKQKLKEQKLKEDYRTNRLMAEVFARKLQRKTLKGHVDLSNSVMVLES